MGAAAPAPVQEVAPGVHRVTLPLPFPPHEVAAWLLEGADGHVLVDTGFDTPGARDALRDGAEALGVTPGSLSHVVLTHAHLDHCGLAGPVRGWSRGARLVMHAEEEALVRRFVEGWPGERAGTAESFRAGGAAPELAALLVGATDAIHGRYREFRPDVVLSGERGPLPGGGGWEWIHTPGHSPGHVAVYHPERRLLIAGDHVLPRISPHVGADLYAEDPLSDYLASLELLRDLPVDLVLPSHGAPFGGLAARVDALRAHHDQRNGRVLEALDRPRPGVEVARRVFGDLPPDNLLHAFRETLAHLIYLERAGRVEREEHGGLQLWRVRG